MTVAGNARSSPALVAFGGAVVAATFLVGVISRDLGRIFQRKSSSDESECVVKLPEWALEYFRATEKEVYTADDEEGMMEVAVELARRNVVEQTGGPFGCAIFEHDVKKSKCRLFAVGVNRVFALNNCTLHAEMVALQFAQQKIGSYSLRSESGDKEYIMCTSCEPCCMCLGGTFWSGLSELHCAATKDDAEAIGFDEGPVFDESYKQLESVGIKVKRKILRSAGSQVLQDYAKSAGVIYNGSSA